ncbi:AraC family transcriptional regulator [Sphingomonas sp. KR3-1]|uniref:helix-turn-helix domain-containing protein n=1 Tax=Sphingomonas sp. KR3-1 TaxID=3156611 RepID=UPI0032B4D540
MEESMLVAGGVAASQVQPSDSFEHHLIVEERAEPSPITPKPRARAHLAAWQVKLARDMMLAQMGDGLALADVARRLGMSVSHFIKGFHESEGVSPYHWFVQRRIAQATMLLRDETIPLSKVADECGFADQSHFTKAFTRLLGVSPGRWRRALRSSARGLGPDLSIMVLTCGND